MEKKEYCFDLAFEVRDYECDLQGVVNNAVYQHYLEHTRHEYIKSVGLDFAKLHNEGIDAVVYRIEIDYKAPLISGDKFVVRLSVQKEGKVRFIFDQDIYKLPQEKLIIRAKVGTTFTQNGRPIKPLAIIDEALSK